MLRRYLALPAQERREAWSALWRLVVVRISLVGGVHRTRRLLGGSTVRADVPLNAEDRALWTRRALALQRVGRRLPGVHCLARSLALRWWMRVCGIPAMLILGARKENDQLQSHSWIELDGRPVDEHPERIKGYSVIWREDKTQAH